jgi:hypothetical protein
VAKHVDQPVLLPIVLYAPNISCDISTHYAGIGHPNISDIDYVSHIFNSAQDTDRPGPEADVLVP